MKNVLLTNDDGFFAEGIRAMADALLRYDGVHVWVVAPDRERSASGHSISLHHPVEVSEKPGGPNRLHVYATSGTPADCVKLALSGLLPAVPCVVLSGINRGPNLGHDVFYSGTVSAAVEAALAGIDAVAVSVAAYEGIDYSFAAEFAATLVMNLIRERLQGKKSLRRPVLLNVNVPAVERKSIAGVAVTRLKLGSPRDSFRRRYDPAGRCWYWLQSLDHEEEGQSDTDVSAIARNLVSITPLKLDLTDTELLEEVSGIAPDFWSDGIPASLGRE